VIGETAISFSGVAAIRVRPIGGTNPRVSGTWAIPLSGALTIIQGQLRQIMLTGAGAGIQPCARRPRRSHGKHWPARFHSVPDPQLALPDPRRLELHALHPSAGRHPTERSLACTVRASRELTAVVASRACRRSPVLRRFHGQRPRLAVAAVVAVAVATAVVPSIEFLSYDSQK
jgi:hypothetical protein